MNDRRVGPPGRASRGGVRPPATMATQARYQPPMASYAPRPVGPWQALRTADGKHVYYHNAATNETTWTRPPDYVDPGPPGGLFPASGSVAAAPSAGSSAPSSVTQIPIPGTTWYEVTQPGKPSYFHDAAAPRRRLASRREKRIRSRRDEKRRCLSTTTTTTSSSIRKRTRMIVSKKSIEKKNREGGPASKGPISSRDRRSRPRRTTLRRRASKRTRSAPRASSASF